MQHIPDHNLNEIERGRQEMEAFRRERSYPDITLTGEEIHNAFCVVDPENAIPWNKVPKHVRQKYAALAKELSRDLNARLAWFEGEEERTITAIKCQSCGEMISDLKGHSCL